MTGPAIPCPFCNETLNVRPFLNNQKYATKRRPGFVFECEGSEAFPHTVKMYLSDFRGDAPFLAAIETPGRKARKLLERAKALSGE